jgi:hypothetical protein
MAKETPVNAGRPKLKVSRTFKGIMIRIDQMKWIHSNHINLSAFVRDKLDKAMEVAE